jgi:hypothetical protein
MAAPRKNFKVMEAENGEPLTVSWNGKEYKTGDSISPGLPVDTERLELMRVTKERGIPFTYEMQEGTSQETVNGVKRSVPNMVAKVVILPVE